jgi:C-terminal processing protease CtpA/Prc
VIHFLHFNFGIQWKYSLIYFGPLYLTALLFALWQFIPHQMLFHRITAGILLTLSVFNVLVSGVPIRLHCYTLQSWTDSFISTVRTMEKEYALSNWKQIDYDALLEEFVPRIQQAEANHDVTQLGIILYDYTNRFYDGHVELFPGTAEIGTDISKALIGNDYGLSLISLDNGTVVAVQIEPGSEAARSGIRTGTVITHWNGVPVEQAKYSFLLPGCPPVAENEEPIRTILLAGQGGESVSITFDTDDGSQKTVQLHRIGDYISRYQTVYNKFFHLTENDENYSYKMITQNCGYLRINAEELSTFEEIYTEFSGQAPFAAKRFEQILSQLQSEGMDRLIIDIRSNTGGNRTVSTALASLFTEETFHYTYGSPSRTEDAHILKGDPWVISGTGKWKDLPVVVLVNQKTVSGGDLMADLMGALPNVTLMGMTPSNGSCQSTGGIIFIAEGSQSPNRNFTFNAVSAALACHVPPLKRNAKRPYAPSGLISSR